MVMTDSSLLLALSIGMITIICIISFLFGQFKYGLVSSTGKCVFISGCDSGIGQKLALHLLELGFVVFAGCLDTNSDSSTPLREVLSDNLYLVKLDITSPESVRNALSHVRNKLKSRELWGLVNNAGICVYGEFEWLTHEQSTKMVQVNLLGTIRLTKMFLPLIRQSKGRIVIVTSVNGDIVYPGLSVYCATKYALEAMSDALRYELKKFGVMVSVIRPGDFARLTNIMRNHPAHVDEMWTNMNQEQKITYANYFHNYHKKVLANYGVTSYKSMESSPLLGDVYHALFSNRPKARYVCAPWYFRVFFVLWKFCPTILSDRLMFALVQIFSK